MHTLYYTQCGKLAKYFDGRFSVSKKLRYWIVVDNLNWFKVLDNVGFINPKTTVHLVPVILKHFAIWYGKLFAFAPWIFFTNVYLCSPQFFHFPFTTCTEVFWVLVNIWRLYSRYALYHRYNILDLESEIVIETLVNESFSFLPLLCQFKRLRMRFYAHFELYRFL